MTWAILVACGLLLAGFALRVGVPVVRRLFVPASVIGGTLGLLLMQWALRSNDASTPLGAFARDVAGTMGAWPGFLIAVIFATLLIEKPDESIRQAARGAGRQAITVYIIILGQTLIGLLATWFFFASRYNVPLAFGQLIEVGWAGGHGTAAAMGVVYRQTLDFQPGLDLGLFSATVGLVWGVISGIVLINIGVRRGWSRSREVTDTTQTGLDLSDRPAATAFARVRSDVIDPLVLQLILLAVAFAIGKGLQWAFDRSTQAIFDKGPDVKDLYDFLSNVPLFMFTLLGGLILRELLHKLRLGRLIDPGSMKRIGGVAIEFLIVSAMTTLRIEQIWSYRVPMAVLMVLAAIWCIVCLVWLSPRLLPRDRWFELGLINYGMSTGTTAQGMMLLRIVDRDLESGAAEDYALAAPLSAPFVGGGIVTLAGVPLGLQFLGPAAVCGILAVAIGCLFFAGLQLNGRAEDESPTTRD